MRNPICILLLIIVALVVGHQAEAQEQLEWERGHAHITPDLVESWPTLRGTSLRVESSDARRREVADADFFVRDLFDQERWSTVRARLVMSGERAAIWVEHSQWDALESQGVLAPLIDSLALALELTPPGAFPSATSQGILGVLSETFGDAPDVDQSGRIDYLLLDIQDGFEQSGQFVAGFFDPVNLTDHPSSNRRDMVYLDVYPTATYLGELHPERIAATAAHETTHLIQAGLEADGPDLTFINEGLAELAEILCGFEPRSAASFLREPGIELLSWDSDSALADYSRASLFMHYLYEQEGGGVIRSLLTSPRRGREGLAEALQSGSGRSVAAFFRQWGHALLVGDVSADARWGYAHPSRAGLRLVPQPITSLPEVVGVRLPPLSFAAYSFSSVNGLSFGASGSALATALVSGAHGVRTLTPSSANGGVSWSSLADGHISPDVLLINGSEAEAQETWFADGTPSGFANLARYDDGTPDPYSGAASLLRVTPQGSVVVAFASVPGFEPRSVATYGLFASELSGSSLASDAPRQVQAQLLEWHDGEPGRPLTEAVIRPASVSYGAMGEIRVSVTDALPAATDSLCVVIATPPGEPSNDFLIGIDRSESHPVSNSGVYSPDLGTWRSFERVRAAGAPLAGFDAMVWIEGIASATKMPFRSVDSRAEGGIATYTLEVPFVADSARSRAFVISGTGDPYPLDIATVEGRVTVHVPLSAGGAASRLRVRLRAAGSPAYSDTTLAWPSASPSTASRSGIAPNPSSGRATTWIDLDASADVVVEVFDTLGRSVYRAEHPSLERGRHFLPVTLGDAASGTYLVRLTMPGDGPAFTHTIQHLR